MLNSLYIKALSKKYHLNELLPDTESNLVMDDFWETKKIYPSAAEFSIGAGDGSFNKKKFLNSNFYAVAAESLIYDGELKQIEFCDLDQINPVPFIDELLGYYMSIFELKCSLRAIRDYGVDYYYLDGSIYGDLQNPFPRGAKAPDNLKNALSGQVLSDFEKEIHELNDYGLTFPKIKNHPIFKGIIQDDPAYDLYLAAYERLMVLKELLEHSRNIVAISKTSNARDIFKSNVPDMAIFDRFRVREGISVIRYVDFKKIKMPFPVYDRFFKKLTFTIFYIRLEDNKNILKVELPYRAKRDEVYGIVEKIKKYSTSGYPYLLNKAHNDVVISDRNIEELLKIAKINEKTNREMLG